MKKGDIISKVEKIEKGTELAIGFSDKDQAESWAKRNGEPWVLVNGSQGINVVASCDFESKEKAKVNWVVGDEMGALNLKEGLHFISSIDGWKVEIEATPSYQSGVEDMSEDQLRNSLEALRNKREKAPRTRRPKVSRAKGPKSQMEKVLAKLPPDKKRKLMEKLGMV